MRMKMMMNEKSDLFYIDKYHSSLAIELVYSIVNLPSGKSNG